VALPQLEGTAVRRDGHQRSWKKVCVPLNQVTSRRYHKTADPKQRGIAMSIALTERATTAASSKGIIEKVAVLVLLGIALASAVGVITGTGADLPMLLQ
jgi:hypothetical protein